MANILSMDFYRRLLPESWRDLSQSGLAWIGHVDLVRVMRVGWRYPAVACAVALTLATLYLAGTKRMYQATARMLILQQGGPPLAAGESGRMLGGEDYLPTHMAILKSPLVVSKAIESVGISELPTLAAARAKSGRSLVDEAIDELTITRPDRSARIVCIDYRAGTPAEAVLFVTALVTSYKEFLEDKFQKSNSDIVVLISAARDNLRKELVEMQAKYLDFRKTHPILHSDESGRSFLSRRVDHWDRAMNEAMVKEVQVRAQIDLGRQLAKDGVEFWAVVHAMNQLGGGDPGLLAHATEPSLGGPTDYVRQLGREQQELAEKFGPGYSKVREIQDQINRIQERAKETRGKIDRAEVNDLLGSLEQSLKTLQSMRAELSKRFEQDVDRAQKTETDLLIESDLKGNIEQSRSLFNTTVEQLKRAQLVGDYNGINAQVIGEANAQRAPVRPRIGLTLVLALLAGLTAGAASALVSDRMDIRVRSAEKLGEVLDVPVLGRVPDADPDAALGPVGLVARAAPFSPQAEAYREVRTHIELHRRERGMGVLLVTSPSMGDGKSTTTSNLAIGLAQTGRRVLLVDADLRRPSQDTIHDITRDRGLSQILQGLVPVHRAIKPGGAANLDLISAGPLVSNPSELLMSARFVEFLQTAREKYDMVLVDSSPVLAVNDPAIIGSLVDGIILVARPATLRTRDAKRAVGIMKAVGKPVLGVVANRVEVERGSYGYGYGYGVPVPPAREEHAALRPGGAVNAVSRDQILSVVDAAAPVDVYE